MLSVKCWLADMNLIGPSSTCASSAVSCRPRAFLMGTMALPLVVRLLPWRCRQEQHGAPLQHHLVLWYYRGHHHPYASLPHLRSNGGAAGGSMLVGRKGVGGHDFSRMERAGHDRRRDVDLSCNIKQDGVIIRAARGALAASSW